MSVSKSVYFGTLYLITNSYKRKFLSPEGKGFQPSPVWTLKSNEYNEIQEKETLVII